MTQHGVVAYSDTYCDTDDFTLKRHELMLKLRVIRGQRRWILVLCNHHELIEDELQILRYLWRVFPARYPSNVIDSFPVDPIAFVSVHGNGFSGVFSRGARNIIVRDLALEECPDVAHRENDFFDWQRDGVQYLIDNGSITQAAGDACLEYIRRNWTRAVRLTRAPVFPDGEYGAVIVEGRQASARTIEFDEHGTRVA